MAFGLSLFCHSRPCPSYPRRRVSYAAGTAASLHQTGDSRLRGSDVKVFEVIPTLVRHSRLRGNPPDLTVKHPVTMDYRPN